MAIRDLRVVYQGMKSSLTGATCSGLIRPEISQRSPAEVMIDNLLWWTPALKAARDSGSGQRPA